MGGPPNANVSPEPVADDGADENENGPDVDGRGGSVFSVGFWPKENGAGEDDCPKLANSLLSEGFISLVKELGVADVPKMNGVVAGIGFDCSLKIDPGVPTLNENVPPPRLGLGSTDLVCTSRVGLSSIRVSWSSSFGGVLGLSVGAIVTGAPKEEKDFVVVSFTLLLSPLNENVTGGAGGADAADESLKLNGKTFVVSTGGGVLGAAPNENGVLARF